MSLGPLMVDVAGLTLTPEDREVLAHPLVGSVLLFSRNYASPEQVAALTAEIRAVRSPALVIAVDHEGGRVQRFRDGFTRLPAARLLGRRFEEDRREGLASARALGYLLARELRAVGVDFSFTPCIDLDYGVSEIIGDRALHRDPDAVGALAVACLAGLRDAGMAAVAKHFPGHGAVVADSHVALPVDRREFADLEPDLRPYRVLIENQLPAVMAAHVVFPAVDPLPASLSRRWINDILRRSLGFHGCVFADDLSMAGAAAFGSMLERAHLALAAGCDVLPLCNDRAAVEQLLNRLDIDIVNPASQARLVRMRARGEAPVSLDQDAGWQEARARIEKLSAPPSLVLTEQPHDAAGR
jgi:beta-N-acetylhexosaminidase